MDTKLVLVVGIALAIASPPLAQGVPGGKSGTWSNGGGNRYTNSNNPDLRFDLDTGRKAVTGRAAAVQAENPTSRDSENNVISRPSSTLVDPHRSLD